MENYKQQFGGQMPEGFLEGLGVKSQVLEQLIQAALLRQGADRIGILMSKEATQRAIEKMKVFDRDGRFDLGRYKEVLEQNRLTPTLFEAGIRNDLVLERVMDAVGAFADLSGKDLQNWIEYSDREIKLVYSVFRGDDFQQQVKVAGDELQTWYEGNKQNYKTSPKIKAQYLFFRYDDDLGQVQVGEAEIVRSFEENRAKYSTPEQRQARHILFKVDPENAKEKDIRKREAEKVLELVRAGGDFAKLADEYSQDPAKGNGGDLGTFSRGRMVKPFEEAVFSMKKGEVSGLVETPFGFHIIKLEGIIPESNRTLAEVKDSISKELSRQAVKGITFKKASAAYEDIIMAGNLQKFSEKSGTAVQATDFFSQENPPTGIGKDPAFLQAAFALRKGELSSLVETSTGYAILYIDERLESVVPEMKDVQERVEVDFKKAKGGELARAAAEKMLGEIREKGAEPAGKTTRESGYVKRFGPPGDVPAPLMEDAFALNDKGVYPDKVVSVEDAFYVYKIADSQQGQDGMSEAERKNLEQQLVASQRNRLVADWLGQLRATAEIWTNKELLQ